MQVDLEGRGRQEEATRRGAVEPPRFFWAREEAQQAPRLSVAALGCVYFHLSHQSQTAILITYLHAGSFHKGLELLVLHTILLLGVGGILLLKLWIIDITGFGQLA